MKNILHIILSTPKDCLRAALVAIKLRLSSFLKTIPPHLPLFLGKIKGWPPLILVVVCALTGCSLGQSPSQVKWMDLGPLPTWPQAEVAQVRHQPVALNVSASPLLANTDIFWRIKDDVNLYAYASSRWAMAPPQLLQQRLMDLLSLAGPTLPSGINSNLPLLYVSLTQFEQRYTADGESSQGYIAMQVVLFQDHHTVATLQLTRSTPATSQTVQGGVLALRAAVDGLTKDLMIWLAQHLPAKQ